jgi:hypothetical protein
MVGFACQTRKASLLFGLDGDPIRHGATRGHFARPVSRFVSASKNGAVALPPVGNTLCSLSAIHSRPAYVESFLVLSRMALDCAHLRHFVLGDYRMSLLCSPAGGACRHSLPALLRQIWRRRKLCYMRSAKALCDNAGVMIDESPYRSLKGRRWF